MFIDSGKIIGTFGKDNPIMTTREELKIEAARAEWKKLISQGWRKTPVVWKIQIHPDIFTSTL